MQARRRRAWQSHRVRSSGNIALKPFQLRETRLPRLTALAVRLAMPERLLRSSQLNWFVIAKKKGDCFVFIAPRNDHAEDRKLEGVSNFMEFIQDS